jgi:hypothetical protein
LRVFLAALGPWPQRLLLLFAQVFSQLTFFPLLPRQLHRQLRWKLPGLLYGQLHLLHLVHYEAGGVAAAAAIPDANAAEHG